MEVTLDLEVSQAEPEDGQFVQATSDLLGERQQAGQTVQFHVQTVPVAFGRIGLHRWRLHTLKQHTNKRMSSVSALLDDLQHVKVKFPF